MSIESAQVLIHSYQLLPSTCRLSIVYIHMHGMCRCSMSYRIVGRHKPLYVAHSCCTELYFVSRFGSEFSRINFSITKRLSMHRSLYFYSVCRCVDCSDACIVCSSERATMNEYPRIRASRHAQLHFVMNFGKLSATIQWIECDHSGHSKIFGHLGVCVCVCMITNTCMFNYNFFIFRQLFVLIQYHQIVWS